MKVSIRQFRDDLKEVADAIKSPKCICIDFGAYQVKYLLAERVGNELKILDHGFINLKKEGLLTTEEINDHIVKLVEKLGSYPLVLLLPQHLVTSQIISVSDKNIYNSPTRLREHLLKETSISGINTATVFYYKKINNSRVYTDPYYVALAKEQNIRDLIGRFTKSTAPIANIVPTLSASTTAFVKSGIDTSLPMVLVDIGEISTNALIFSRGERMTVANFPIGGEYFTDQLSKALRCTFEEARQLKMENNYLTGDKVNAMFQVAIKHWIKDIVNWFLELAKTFSQNTNRSFSEAEFEAALEKVPIYLSGGGSLTPGLLEYIRLKTKIPFQRWPGYNYVPEEVDSILYSPCIGAALETLHLAPTSETFLPENLVNARENNRQRFFLQMFALFCTPFLLIILIVAIMFVGSSIEEASGSVAQYNTQIPRIKKLQNNNLAQTNILNNYKELLFSYLPTLQKEKRAKDLLNILKTQQEIVNNSTNAIWFLSLTEDNANDSYRSEFCINTEAQCEDLTTIPNLFVTNPLCSNFISCAATPIPANRWLDTNYIDAKYIEKGSRGIMVFKSKDILTPTETEYFSQLLENQKTNKVKR